MAMNGNTLGTAIKNAIDGLTQEQKEDLETVWQAVASQILSHITSNAEVATAVTGTADLDTGDVTGTGSGGVS